MSFLLASSTRRVGISSPPAAANVAAPEATPSQVAQAAIGGLLEAMTAATAARIELTDEADEAIDAVVAEDAQYIASGLLADIDAGAVPAAEVPERMRRVARDLWEVSRWELPVDVRWELNLRRTRDGVDAGWQRYAARLGVAA